MKISFHFKKIRRTCTYRDITLHVKNPGFFSINAWNGTKAQMLSVLLLRVVDSYIGELTPTGGKSLISMSFLWGWIFCLSGYAEIVRISIIYNLLKQLFLLKGKNI